MIYVLLLLVIVLLLILIQTALSSSRSIRDYQLTSLESGFEIIKYGVLLRSSFFLLGVLFVLFDVELILLLPLVLYRYTVFYFKFNIIVLVICFVLISLFLEWYFSGLKWRT